MNIEETKKYLSRGLEIKKKLDKLKYLYDKSTSHDNIDPTVKITGQGNSTELGFVSHAHISVEIDKIKIEFDEVTKEISRYIRDNCDDAFYGYVLTRRYAWCQTFPQIAKDLGLSQSYIYSLHAKGLKIIVQ